MLDAAEEGELWSTVEEEAPLEIPEELLEELVPMANMSQVASFATALVKAKKEKEKEVEAPRKESLVPSETSAGTEGVEEQVATRI